MSSHAASHRRVPTVLDVPFTKLMRRRSQQMFAKQLRMGMDPRHGILQLVAIEEAPKDQLQPSESDNMIHSLSIASSEERWAHE